MAPNNLAICHRVGRLKQVRAADFFVTFRAELRDDEIAFLVRQKKAVAVFDDERSGPAFFFSARGNKCFPHTLAGVSLKATELAITARAVNVAVLDEWRGDDAVKRVGIALAIALAAPDLGGRRLVAVKLQHQ